MNITPETMKGLFVPLVTPMKYGAFDYESMKKLIASLESEVDGYVPCLSSGEGHVLTNDQWAEVVACVRASTTKPVIAGIKRESVDDTIALARKAEELGCDGFITPVLSKDQEVIKEHFNKVIRETNLPFVIYNTETANIDSIAFLKELDQAGRIVAIKDSSMNREFFAEMCNARVGNELKMSVLQGMEHQLDVPKGCDGYLVSLLNVEARLVRSMFENPNKENLENIYKKFMQYNLGSEWYVTLKAVLLGRGLLESAEQVQQFFSLDKEILKELQLEKKVPIENSELGKLK